MSVYLQIIKLECHVKKNVHFRHFAFNQSSKAGKTADFYSSDFYQRGIENHFELWKEVVNNNGEYIIDIFFIKPLKREKRTYLPTKNGGNLVANLIENQLSLANSRHIVKLVKLGLSVFNQYLIAFLCSIVISRDSYLMDGK